MSATRLVKAMSKKGILAGVPLGKLYRGMDNSLLVCATEMRTTDDLERYAAALRAVDL
jgi:glycine dehydrogenase subunit 1